jgi:hypothetical protein
MPISIAGCTQPPNHYQVIANIPTTSPLLITHLQSAFKTKRLVLTVCAGNRTHYRRAGRDSLLALGVQLYGQ